MYVRVGDLGLRIEGLGFNCRRAASLLMFFNFTNINGSLVRSTGSASPWSSRIS